MRFTIDNHSRNPLHWGKCTIKQANKPIKIWGFEYKKRDIVEYLTIQWVFVIFFGTKYKALSNFPLDYV